MSCWQLGTNKSVPSFDWSPSKLRAMSAYLFTLCKSPWTSCIPKVLPPLSLLAREGFYTATVSRAKERLASLSLNLSVWCPLVSNMTYYHGNQILRKGSTRYYTIVTLRRTCFTTETNVSCHGTETDINKDERHAVYTWSSLIPRSTLPPVLDHVQYKNTSAKTEVFKFIAY